FFGTTTAIEGIGLREVAEESLRRHRLAFSDDMVLRRSLDVGGEYAYRIRGEAHAWDPNIVANLQHAVRTKDDSPEDAQARYDAFAAAANGDAANRVAIRSLFEIKPLGPEIDISEVEPAEAIVRRFATGAMSFGSISREAHTTLA